MFVYLDINKFGWKCWRSKEGVICSIIISGWYVIVMPWSEQSGANLQLSCPAAWKGLLKISLQLLTGFHASSFHTTNLYFDLTLSTYPPYTSLTFLDWIASNWQMINVWWQVQSVESGGDAPKPHVAKSYSFGGYAGSVLTRGDSVLSTHSAGARLLTKQGKYFLFSFVLFMNVCSSFVFPQKNKANDKSFNHVIN